MKKKSFINLCFLKTQLLILGLVIGIFSSSAFARTLIFQSDSEKSLNAPVIQQHGTLNGDSNAVASQATASASSANSELFFMIEQLQQEVNSLRGLLEEQSYELRMLKQSGKDRYLDLDTRILDLTKRLSSSDKQTDTPQQHTVSFNTVSSSTMPSNTSSPRLLADKESTIKTVEPIRSREPTKAEADEYQKAYAFIKDKKFDDSVIALFSYTENYPDSPLLPNVYYWLGEVYLATSKLEQAKTSFSLVVSAYPNSQKVSDSLYKLAVTSDLLGNKAQAKQYINDVLVNYPDSTSAKLAASYKISE